jgi:hypothetical protein
MSDAQAAMNHINNAIKRLFLRIKVHGLVLPRYQM